MKSLKFKSKQEQDIWETVVKETISIIKPKTELHVPVEFADYVIQSFRNRSEGLFKKDSIYHDQLKQLTLNMTWLIEQFDTVHDLLCPEYGGGTWQQRVNHVMDSIKIKGKGKTK